MRDWVRSRRREEADHQSAIPFEILLMLMLMLILTFLPQPSTCSR